MNSSLLVPALIVLAVTAGVFVFGESLFSGSESESANEYAVSQPQAKQPADVEPTVRGSDFSWDETTIDAAQSSLESAPKSFVSTKQSEDAPAALYGSNDDSQSDESFESAGDVASSGLALSNDSTDLGADDLRPALDLDTASKQVDDDLADFFSRTPKADDSGSSTARSSVSRSVQTPSTPKEKTVNPPETELAMASPINSDSSVDTFDNFGSDSSDFSTAPSTEVVKEMKSVVAGEANKIAPKQLLDVAFSGDEESSVISGALEPMKDSNDQSAMGGSNDQVNAPVRKFKITNPKATTLAVTLSVDGKQVTLKPDQSYVIQDSKSDVKVTFSRGGSFGFQTKTLSNGHYRFTVSREAGWQLVN